MNNLTTPQGRADALKLLHSELIEKLHSLNLGFAKDLHCRIEPNFVEIGIKNDNNDAFSFLWASSFVVYPPVNRYNRIQTEEISVAASGNFSPKDKGPFWRTF